MSARDATDRFDREDEGLIVSVGVVVSVAVAMRMGDRRWHSGMGFLA